MRLPKSAHTARPWRIHDVAHDFDVEDVWALPMRGGRDDFPEVVRWAASIDPTNASSFVVRVLFEVRWRLGGVLGWDAPDTGVGTRVPTLRDRLPADLREASAGPGFEAAPFTPLYLTGDEFAAETANRTMHGVLHLGWVPDRDGGYRGQLAILVKRNGLLGTAYMAAIKPFRHLIVYPAMLRQAERSWEARVRERAE